jgi:hypothetical protein
MKIIGHGNITDEVRRLVEFCCTTGVSVFRRACIPNGVHTAAATVLQKARRAARVQQHGQERTLGTPLSLSLGSLDGSPSPQTCQKYDRVAIGIATATSTMVLYLCRYV